MFVSTRVGQLRNECELIREYAPAHPRMLIMTPERDHQLRDTMIGMAEAGPVEAFEVAILPNFPASAKSIFKRSHIYRAMRDATERLLDGATSVDVYLHHANRYYVYFERILAELGVECRSLNMVEEGMATYRWSCPGMEDVAAVPLYKPTEALRRIGLALRDAGKSLLRCIKYLGRALVRVGEFVLACLSAVSGVNLFSACVSCIERLQPKRYRFGIVRHFDNGYFCFPEKMRSAVEIHIDAVHPLALAGAHDDEDSQGEENSQGAAPSLDHVDAMFASQKYGDPAVYYELVLDIFEEMGLRSVFFKFHPREEFNQVLPYLEAAAHAHPSLSIVHDRRLDSVPIEELLLEHNCTCVIGLTTSTLMYVPLIRSDLKAVSIGQRFFELYCERDPSGAGGQGLDMKTFREDLEAFCAIFPEVEQFAPGESGAPGAPESAAAAPDAPGALTAAPDAPDAPGALDST